VDQQRGTGDKLLTGSRSVPALAAGYFSSGTVDVTIPAATTPGTYHVLACADDTSVVPETNEGNNCLASTGQLTVGP
jgi:subtilase family serine protease